MSSLPSTKTETYYRLEYGGKRMSAGNTDDRRDESESMVYVDELRYWPNERVKPGARRWGNQWCHLFTDVDALDQKELHNFAEMLGLKRVWFQNHDARPQFWHYDLTKNKREKAIRMGAQFKSAWDHVREIVEVVKKEREEREQNDQSPLPVSEVCPEA